MQKRAILFSALMLVFGFAMPSWAQVTKEVPCEFVRGGTLTVAWKQCAVLNGGNLVNIAAGTVTVTASKATCGQPVTNSNVAACNYLIVSTTGTVTATTSPSTATASGYRLLGLVRTNGTTIIGIAPAAPPNPTFPQLYNGNASGGATLAILGEGFIHVDTSCATGATTASCAITGLPFTATTLYGCTVSGIGTTTVGGGRSYVKDSATQVTAYGAYSDTISLVCVGK